jgi:hypothetical protein
MVATLPQAYWAHRSSCGTAAASGNQKIKSNHRLTARTNDKRYRAAKGAMTRSAPMVYSKGSYFDHFGDTPFEAV